MSIQPNRVIARIIEQVDGSDWPALETRWVVNGDGPESIRLYWAKADPRYATPLHFWVHALREELSTRDRRSDLVGAAGHALCWNQSTSDWWEELEAFAGADEGAGDEISGPDWAAIRALGQGPRSHAHRMLESGCRRSSVVGDDDWWFAHFWGHGSHRSWAREALR